MLLYHIKLPEEAELYQSARGHEIWRIYEFWETSFVESVFEYFEMAVIYYQKGL
jgi:hypothetical protein